MKKNFFFCALFSLFALSACNNKKTTKWFLTIQLQYKMTQQ